VFFFGPVSPLGLQSLEARANEGIARTMPRSRIPKTHSHGRVGISAEPTARLEYREREKLLF